MKKKNNILPIVLALLFISPVFFVDERLNILYVFVMGVIGWGIGLKIINYRKRKRGKRFLSNIAIATYVALYLGVYLLISIIDGFEIFKSNILNSILWITFTAYLLFYGGLIQIRDRRGRIRLRKIRGKIAVRIGIFLVITAILLLILTAIVVLT